MIVLATFVISLSNSIVKKESQFGKSSIQEALQRAKRVAETSYSVIGIVEEFNITLAVMEAYLPGCPIWLL